MVVDFKNFSQTYDCSQPADHRHVRPGAFKPGAVGARSLIVLQQKKELEAGRKELSDFRDFVTDEMVPNEERDRSFKRTIVRWCENHLDNITMLLSIYLIKSILNFLPLILARRRRQHNCKKWWEYTFFLSHQGKWKFGRPSVFRICLVYAEDQGVSLLCGIIRIEEIRARWNALFLFFICG